MRRKRKGVESIKKMFKDSTHIKIEESSERERE
jgi:hypothetical protein